VNVRIVAATNRNLQEAIKTGRLRQDLFFRLDVLTVEMPRLSERREDYPAACGARHEKLWPNPYASVSVHQLIEKTCLVLLRRHAAFGRSHVGSSGSELVSSRRQSAWAHSYVGLSHFQVG